MNGAVEDESESKSFDEMYGASARSLDDKFTNRLIKLFWQARTDLKSRLQKNRLTKESVFLRTGIHVNPPMDVFGHDFYEPDWLPYLNSGTLENILMHRMYVGIDLQDKHITQYADILAKMRLAYDFAKEKDVDLYLPRLYCKLRQDGKDVAILTEDVSADGFFRFWDGVSDKDYAEQGLGLFDELFSAEDMDRHFFHVMLRGDNHLFPLVDLDHVSVGKKYVSRHFELVQAYRDKYVHEI